MMRRLLAWLGRLLERIPRMAGWILAATILAFLLAGTAIVDPRDGTVHLEVDVAADRLLPDRDEARRFYERSRRMFGSDDTLLVAISDRDVFQPEVLARIVPGDPIGAMLFDAGDAEPFAVKRVMQYDLDAPTTDPARVPSTKPDERR